MNESKSANIGQPQSPATQDQLRWDGKRNISDIRRGGNHNLTQTTPHADGNTTPITTFPVPGNSGRQSVWRRIDRQLTAWPISRA
jgi:hypothetical protein